MTIRAVIDTGATITVASRRLLREAGGQEIGRSDLGQTFLGETVACTLYQVRLRLERSSPLDVIVYGVEEVPEVLIGMNVLNAFTISIEKGGIVRLWE